MNGTITNAGIGINTKKVKENINNELYYNESATIISSSDNLDNLVTPGRYLCNETDNSFILIVNSLGSLDGG